jgi:hypothetical protein
MDNQVFIVQRCAVPPWPLVHAKAEEDPLAAVPELIQLVAELKGLISDSQKQIRALQSISSHNEWLTGRLKRALDDYRHEVWYEELNKKRAKV